MAAACRDQRKCVEVLLEAGADVNQVKKNNRHARRGHGTCDDLLLAGGADVNKLERCGPTWYTACYDWSLEEAGANEDTDEYGKTAWTLAAFGHDECASVL